MARFIVECEDPTNIILGMKVIKGMIKDNEDYTICVFEDDSVWYGKKTKTGYSARTRNG